MTPEERTQKVLSDIKNERDRQQTVENWTPEHDDTHTNGEMPLAAACYAASSAKVKGFPFGHIRNLFGKSDLADGGFHFKNLWPWASHWDKRDKHDRRRQLVIAGALISAEIERLDREEEKKNGE